MSAGLAIATIVEGHGEVRAVPVLLRRIWFEMLGGERLELPRPIRCPRGRIPDQAHLSRAIAMARLKLRRYQALPSAILVLADADDDLPCELGPRLQTLASVEHSDLDVFSVIAMVEYETWFCAAAESLRPLLPGLAGKRVPEDPEGQRLGKGWVERSFNTLSARYSPSVDQARLTAHMDLEDCRRRSPSFDKLVRELERRRVEEPGAGSL